MDKPQVLIVDDHPDTLELFAVLLRDRYRVIPCSSAVDALKVLDTAHPDIVILDIGMAPVNGVECLKRIRARPEYAGIPAIALTAFAREQDRRRFLAAGFQTVITKPVLDEPVIAAVEALLPGHQRLTLEETVGMLSDRGKRSCETRGVA